MKNLPHILLTIIIFITVSISVFTYLQPVEQVAPLAPEHKCSDDSLQKVINQMEVDLEGEEIGWDTKERRYEEIIFEYEYGIDHLKNYHPEAYRDFHRIISHRESYSREDEKENKKRLKIGGNKW